MRAESTSRFGRSRGDASFKENLGRVELGFGSVGLKVCGQKRDIPGSGNSMSRGLQAGSNSTQQGSSVGDRRGTRMVAQWADDSALSVTVQPSGVGFREMEVRPDIPEEP